MTIFIVFDQAIAYKVLALFTNSLKSCMIKVELALDYILNDLRLRAPWEWHLTREHDVENDSHAPDVDLHVVLLEEYFWSDVIWRP